MTPTTARFLWQITLTTPPAAAEAVARVLERVSGHPTVIYQPVDNDNAIVTAYAKPGFEWDYAKTQALANGLGHLRRLGLTPAATLPTLTRLPEKNWAESWRHHFRTLDLGPALRIQPTWSQRPPQTGQTVVVLDPGLSFGTGHHPTTAFCLRQIIACRQTRHAQSLLDVGTGSGILAIAAARLGYETVVAFDDDPVAVRMARANARRNDVLSRLRLRRLDLQRLPCRARRPFDVVCANLEAGLLIDHAPRLIGQLHPEGTLVVAGILRTQFAAVCQAYQSQDLILKVSRVGREWRSGAFAFRRP